jgi:surface polysaccharide O-acyltransferase-like enzyme
MEDDFFNLASSKKLEKQAERWDLYAKFTPPFFLMFAGVLLVFNLIKFDTLFYVGLGMFSITAVVWWFWSIFTIRFIIRNMTLATKGLNEVKQDLKSITSEMKDLRDE